MRSGKGATRLDSPHQARSVAPTNSSPVRRSALSHFPTLSLCSPPTASATTAGLTVTIRAFRHIENPTMGYAYRVSVHAEPGFSGSATLAVRNWVFEKEGGRRETVRGEGVVGMFPTISEGGYELDGGGKVEGKFEYWSCTGDPKPLKMGGWIEFYDGRKAMAPEITFQLDMPAFG